MSAWDDKPFWRRIEALEVRTALQHKALEQCLVVLDAIARHKSEFWREANSEMAQHARDIVAAVLKEE